MRPVRLLLPLLAVALLACTIERKPVPAAPLDTADEIRAVEGVLTAWYAAVTAHDSAAYARPLLPEFFIIEDTVRYDRDTLVRLVVESFAQGTDRATMYDHTTVVTGDVAWSTFRNDEVFTPTGGAPLPMRRYLETVVFRRVDGSWRMARYHATRINR